MEKGSGSDWDPDSLLPNNNDRAKLKNTRSVAQGNEPQDHLENGTPQEREQQKRSRSRSAESGYDIPDSWLDLDEVAATSPVENVRESPIYRHSDLEREREERHEEHERRASLPPTGISESTPTTPGRTEVSRLLTEFYTLSYLVFFAILGTLGRVGLSALTSYPGAPVIFGSIWPNFAGSLVMGFLAEDRMLLANKAPRSAEGRKKTDEENGSGLDHRLNGDQRPQSNHLAIKKTIPLYIGAATGFCGSLTSFSSFIRDVFLALSNDMATPGTANSPTSRNGGYSFMAVLAVVILTLSLSLSALFLGAHIAIALERIMPSIQYPITRKILDPMAVVLGWGSWIGAVFMAIFPPHAIWRGRAVFAIVFAPLGCLLRFYVSLYLNGMVASFPLGTFAVNVFGTGILGMCWDLAHVPIGGVIGCQVLQGVEDGFCGALTTVSTWVVELSSLRRRHAYVYGVISVVVSLILLVAIMGGLRWSHGFSTLLCST